LTGTRTYGCPTARRPSSCRGGAAATTAIGATAKTTTAAAKATFSRRPATLSRVEPDRARTPGTSRTTEAARSTNAGKAGMRMRKMLASSIDAGKYVPLSST
jgi:hypothetical protein